VAHGGWGSTPGDAGGSGQARPRDGKRAAPWAVPADSPTRPPAVGTPPDPPAPASVGGGRRGGGRRLAAVLVALVLLAGGVGATWFLTRDDGAGTEAAATGPAFGAPQSSAPRSEQRATGEAADGGSTSPARTSAPATSATPTSPPVLTENRALAQLRSLRADSLARLSLDGRWVAQVASKSVGITDPLQVAANGTHTFYAVDILVESRTVGAAASKASSVLVLQSLDFGKRSVDRDGRPYWVTLVDEGFSSSDEVDQWCARAFAMLTPEQLANACAARTLRPPHD
jgi:hypothetical protein